MIVTLVPPGRGRWSALVLTYDPKRRGELPLPVGLRVGERVEVLGVTYRVAKVEGSACQS